MANAAADGSGADKTANLTVTLSYPAYNSYGKGGKLVLANSDTSPIYVTRLTVRGRGWLLKDRGSVYVEDATSKTNYGERSHNIDANILTTLAEAQTLADDIETKSDTPRSKIVMYTVNGTKETLQRILGLQISDRITLNDATESGINEDFYINKKDIALYDGGMIVECVFTLEEVA